MDFRMNLDLRAAHGENLNMKNTKEWPVKAAKTTISKKHRQNLKTMLLERHYLETVVDTELWKVDKG